MNLPLKSLLAKTGIGLGGLGLGLGIGRYQTNKLENTFNNYNTEENAQIADQAFLGGVEYAMEQMGLEKDSFYNKIAKDAFNDEIEKIAGTKELVNKAISSIKPMANKAKNVLDQTFTSGIRKYKNIQKNPHKNSNINQLLTSMYKDDAKRNVRNMAIAGAGVGAGVIGTKALSSDKE